jgi:acyl-homoserine-lactone acylase
MTSRTVSVKLKDGSTQKHTFWYSRYGQLVTVAQAGYGWDKQYAYALGDVNAENLRIADVWLALDKAKSVDDLVKAQSKYQGVPWVNTIAADDKGQALYQDNSVVPHVTDQQQKDCIPAGLPAIVHSAAGIITLDGSRSACAWGSDPDAVVRGIFGPKNLPILKRRDYVQNSNDSYWMTNSKVPITGIPEIVGDTNTALGLRTRYGLREINERLTGSDGESGKGYTIGLLRKMWSSADSEGGLLLKNQLADFCATTPTVDIGGGKIVDISAACPIVRNWDASARLDSKGDWLFTMWSHFADDTFADKFDPANPLTTPNRLATTNANLVALGKAVQALRDRGLPLDATTRQVQFLERRGVKIPVRGCDTGCYAAIDASVDPAADSKSSGIPIEYGQVLYGSSIVETIELTKKGPKGGTILTYSESENPDSKHSGDQTKLFSENGWVPLTFSEKQILGNKDLKTTTLSGR